MAFYKEVFEARGALYNHAMAICPEARSSERDILLEALGPVAGQIVVDAPAGGGYVADKLDQLGAEVVCVEPSPNFAQAISSRFRTILTDIYDIPVEDRAVDKVASLAGLHHLTPDQLSGFFRESARILRPGGVMAVADVMSGTAPAAFLNGFVDTHTETGHDGRFFNSGEMEARMRECGLVGVSEELREFHWVFPNHGIMVDFMRSLFGLTLASLKQVEDAVHEILGVDEVADGLGVRWSLLYATGQNRSD